MFFQQDSATTYTANYFSTFLKICCEPHINRSEYNYQHMDPCSWHIGLVAVAALTGIM
jgi:hypothetical protein